MVVQWLKLRWTSHIDPAMRGKETALQHNLCVPPKLVTLDTAKEVEIKSWPNSFEKGLVPYLQI